MNDTTRMVGGALGVAVIGSVLSSSYSDAMGSAVSNLPARAALAASDSVGAALNIAGRIGPQGSALAQAARTSFVESMGDAVIVAAGVALLGAAVALIFLPAQPRVKEIEPEVTRPLETAPTY